MAVKPIPEGYPRVSPYLHVDDAAAAIDFYVDVLGASERVRMDQPDGRIGHAELQLGDSVVMLADEFPEMGIRGPKAIGGSPVTMSVYVEDVDAVFEKAVGAGAKVFARRQGRVLRRPLRAVRGSVRPPLEHRDARRGRFGRGDGPARR